MLDGISDLSIGAWLLATITTGLLAVFVSGYLARRIPSTRARWATAGIGLFAFAVTWAPCSATTGPGASTATCRALVGQVMFEFTQVASAETVQTLLLAVALAAGVAPLAVPVVRQRARLRAERGEPDDA